MTTPAAADPTPAPASPPAPAAEPKPADTPAEPVVPEAYTFELREGFELGDDARALFSQAFKDLHLTQEAANKLAETWQQVQESRTAEQDRLFAAEVTQMAKELREHPELGGKDHDNLMRDLSAFARQTFGEDTMTMLTHLGLHVHSGFLSGLAKLRASRGEDRFAPGQRPNTQQTDQETFRKLYPNSPDLFPKT